MTAEISGDTALWAHHDLPGISPELLRIAEAERNATEILSWSPNSVDPLLWMPDYYTSYPNYQGSTATRENNFEFEKARARAVIASSREGHPRVMHFVTSLAALGQANIAGTGHGEHIAGINELPGVNIQVFEDLSRVWPSQLRNSFRVIRGQHDTLAVAEHALGVVITDDPEAIQDLTEHFRLLTRLAKPLGEITVPAPVFTPLPDHGMGHRPLPDSPPSRVVENTPPL